MRSEKSLTSSALKSWELGNGLDENRNLDALQSDQNLGTGKLINVAAISD